MKHIAILSFLFATCSCAAWGQNYSLEFGKISQFETELKSYTEDTSANALILYDIGKSEFIYDDTEGFKLITEHSRKIKIFNQTGFEHAEIEIPFYRKEKKGEEVYDITAVTYNYENGKIVETRLDPERIFTEKKSEFWQVKKFAMPAVKENSIIEYKYKLRSPYFTAYQDWEFQQEIPVRYSKYLALMNPFYTYVWYLQGTVPLDYHNSYKDSGLPKYVGSIDYKELVYEFVIRDVPAFNDETFITSKNDYIGKINFQLSQINHYNGATENVITTWEKLNSDLLKESSFGKFLKASEKKTKAITEELNLTGSGPLKKIETIVEYVKSNYEWNGYNGYIPYGNVKEFLDSKTGAAADLNLFLTALLRNSGIESYPVLLSTRDHGKIKSNYPFLESFNYVAVLAKFENSNVVLDATNPGLPSQLIPTKCINDQGLIVKKDEENWVTLKSNASSVISVTAKLKFNQDHDSLTGTYNIVSTGYDAVKFRKNFLNSTEKKRDYFQKRGLSINEEVNEQGEDKKRPYTFIFIGSYPIEKIFDKTYIAPFAEIPYSENPLKKLDRKYPVDLIYPKSKVFNIFIEVPDECTIEHLPKSMHIDNKLFKLEYNAVLNENIININAEYSFKNAVYSGKEYKLIRYYFEKIAEKFNEKIVIVNTMQE